MGRNQNQGESVKNSKKLEDATKGDFLVYIKPIEYFEKSKIAMTKVDLIPCGSVLEIMSIYRKKDGLCTIKVNGIYVLESPNIILIDNYKTYNYKEFVIVDKSHKPVIYTLYDV